MVLLLVVAMKTIIFVSIKILKITPIHYIKYSEKLISIYYFYFVFFFKLYALGKSLPSLPEQSCILSFNDCEETTFFSSVPVL